LNRKTEKEEDFMNDIAFCFTALIVVLILGGIGYVGIKLMVKYEKTALSLLRFFAYVILGAGIVAIFA